MGRGGACLPLGEGTVAAATSHLLTFGPGSAPSEGGGGRRIAARRGPAVDSPLPIVGTIPRIPLERPYLRQVEDRRTYPSHGNPTSTTCDRDS